jgi:hypothetical protein
MIEEKDYDVTIVVKLKTHIYFAACERDTPITPADAVANATGCMLDEDWYKLVEGYGGEFVTEMEFLVKET